MIDPRSSGGRKLRNLESRPNLRRLAVVGYLSNLIPSQRAEASEILDHLATLLGGPDAFAFAWEKVSPEDLPRLDELRDRFSHWALSRAKKALNGVLQEAVFLGLMSSRNYSEVRDVSWNRVRPTLRAGSDLTWRAVEPLFSVCAGNSSPASKRDGGLFGLIWVHQAGVKDAISFPNSPEGSRLQIECGNLVIPPIVSKAVMSWSEVRGPGSGPFLTSISRTGEVVPVPMTAHAVEYAFRRRCDEAGIHHRLGAEELRRLSVRVQLVSNSGDSG